MRSRQSTCSDLSRCFSTRKSAPPVFVSGMHSTSFWVVFEDEDSDDDQVRRCRISTGGDDDQVRRCKEDEVIP